MKNIFILLSILVSLSSCFKTDLSTGALPFSLENSENGSEIRLTYDLATTVAATEYFGRGGVNIGSSPDNSKALISTVDLCITRVETSDLNGAFTGNIHLVVNGKDYDQISLSSGGDSIDTNVRFHSGDKLLLRIDSNAISGTLKYTMYFSGCDY